MKRFTVAIVVAFAVAASANAGVLVTSTGVPTTDLEGFTTWTVNATSDSGPINGIDATFAGPMNHVNPNGMATVFNDTNGFFGFVFANASQDSQFLFKSDKILSTATGEGDSLLKGALTNLSAYSGGSMSIDFAQIVIANGGSVTFSADFDDGGAGAVSVEGVVGIPEPATFALMGLALIGIGFLRRSK
jgi:hypothetical protein